MNINEYKFILALGLYAVAKRAKIMSDILLHNAGVMAIKKCLLIIQKDVEQHRCVLKVMSLCILQIQVK